MNSTESRSPATLSPVPLTPEEAAAVAVALAAQPDGPYAEAGRTALEKVLVALETDPRVREQLLARCRGIRAQAPTVGRHPAGRALTGAAVPGPPKLTVLPGGRA